MMNLKAFLGLLCLTFFLYSCDQVSKQETSTEFQLLYESSQFSISQKGSSYLLKIKQQLKGSSLEESYLLFSRDEGRDSSIEVTHAIPYPISSCAISSVTHLGFLEALGMENTIIAANSQQLYYSRAFRKRIEEGKVANIGNASFNEEVLIEKSPDVLFTFALSKDNIEKIEDLRRSGTKVVLINEYLETDPIAKAAWLKYFAIFFGREKLDKADEYLLAVQDQYEGIKELMALAKSKPAVMIGLPWKGTWYVSGGNSYQAHFFEDAAVNYLWNKYKEEGSVPLDVEVVLEGGLKADYWINPGAKQSLEEVIDADERFSNFAAFQNKKVYSNYKRTNDNGANDYWERGVVRPDLILKDLAIIFHPELMEGQELYFYKQLN